MGLPAARVGDAAGHGGAIIFGTPTVLIGGLPAARMGDLIVCPGFNGPVPHVLGNITMASTTVMIGGAFAARQGDMTGCGAAGVSGAGMPPVAGPPAAPETPGGTPGSFNYEGNVTGGAITRDAEGNEEDNGGLLYGRYSGYQNEDGEAHAVTGSLEHFHGATTLGDGSTLEGTFDGVTGNAEVHAGGAFSGGVSANVSGVSASVRNHDEAGNSMGASGGLFNAAAGADFLLGSDGRRTGIGASAVLSASVAEGQVDRVQVCPIPFTDYTINFGSTLGGSLESIGGAGAAGAYHDAADDRYHLMGMVDIEFVVGAKVGADFSIGRAAAADGSGGAGTPGIPVPMTPGPIIMGCANVLIG